MKQLIGLVLIIPFIAISSVYAKPITISMRLQQAKILYDAMTGPGVQNDGAVGHLYRIGKSVSCRYTDADMDDAQGKLIPQQDPRRYECTIKFDNNGLALSP